MDIMFSVDGHYPVHLIKKMGNQSEMWVFDVGTLISL